LMSPKRFLTMIIIICGLIVIGTAVQVTPSATATPPRQDDTALIERGEYLANIGACVFCHTPFLPEYLPEHPDYGEDEIYTLALFERDALDIDRLFAGGHAFN